MLSLQWSWYTIIRVSFKIFALIKSFCFSLNFVNLQIIVYGQVGFFFFRIIRWQRSISMFSSVPIFILNISCTFVSHFPQVSLGILTVLSIWMLFHLDRSSSSMSFFVSIRVFFNFLLNFFDCASKFLISVLIVFSLSSNWSWVCSRLLVSSAISVDNLSNHSCDDFIFEFIISLIATSWADSSSLTIVLMVFRRIWSFSCGCGTVSVSGVGFNLSILIYL